MLRFEIGPWEGGEKIGQTDKQTNKQTHKQTNKPEERHEGRSPTGRLQVVASPVRGSEYGRESRAQLLPKKKIEKKIIKINKQLLPSLARLQRAGVEDRGRAQLNSFQAIENLLRTLRTFVFLEIDIWTYFF